MAEVVTTVAQVPEEIAPVPRAAVPLAIVCEIVAFEFGKVNVLVDEAGPETAKNPLFEPPLADGSNPVTFAVKSIVAAAISAFTTDDEVTVCVDPAKCATPAPGDDAITQVAQAIVPVEVIVPPVIGEVVAIDVTPDPPGQLVVVKFLLPSVQTTKFVPRPVTFSPANNPVLPVKSLRARQPVFPDPDSLNHIEVPAPPSRWA